MTQQTECCHVPIAADQRFCPKCGYEARASETPRFTPAHRESLSLVRNAFHKNSPGRAALDAALAEIDRLQEQAQQKVNRGGYWVFIPTQAGEPERTP